MTDQSPILGHNREPSRGLSLLMYDSLDTFDDPSDLHGKENGNENGNENDNSTIKRVSFFDKQHLRRSGLVRKLVKQTSERTSHYVATLTSSFMTFEDSNEPLKWTLIFISIYLLVGFLAFHSGGQLTVIQALYFAIVTSTTTGYGDYHADSEGDRIFMVFYILVGVTGLGVGLGVIGDKLIASRVSELKKNDDVTTFSCRSILKELNYENEDDDDDCDNCEVFGIISWKDLSSFLKRVLPYCLLSMVGSLIIGYLEGWTPITSIYYWAVTSTSVGYGDVTPKKPSMQLFCVFYIPVAIAVMTTQFLAGIANMYMNGRARQLEKEFMSRPLTIADIYKMDDNESGDVDFGEFLSHMLITMKKVDEKVIKEIHTLFDKLDVDKNGVLNERDLDRLDMLREKRVMKMSSRVGP